MCGDQYSEAENNHGQVQKIAVTFEAIFETTDLSENSKCKGIFIAKCWPFKSYGFNGNRINNI